MENGICLRNLPTRGNDCIECKEVTNFTGGANVKNMDERERLEVNEVPRFRNLRVWCARECFSVKLLKRRLPIIVWLPKYNLEDFKGDLVAGSTVALTVIPQGLAQALLAGLPPQYGLYTSFMGCFIYTLFGSCKDLTIGPTSILSLMTLHHVTIGGVTYSIILTFLSGFIMLLMGLLNLGFLITFISSSVVTGFTTAAAITIATTQLGGVFGMKFQSEGFIEDLTHFFNGLANNQIKYWDMTMGIGSIIFLLLLRYFRNLKFGQCLPRQISKALESLWFIIATARNAILVLICTGIAATLMSHGINVLTLTQEIETGLPPFKLPTFSYSYFDNTTNHTIHKDFGEIAKDMGSGLIVISLLAILEAIAIAKSFAKGKKIDATQEMIALGLCNIMGSFVSAYPATGSFSRTAINYNSGVRTTAGGVVTGSFVLLALAVMSPCFHFIPKASLAALIIVAVLNMVHYKEVFIMWKTNKLDLLPYLATIVFSFILGLEYGIGIGVGISLCLLLAQESRPKILVREQKTLRGNYYLYVRPSQSVLYPSSEYFHNKIIKSIPDVAKGEIYTVIVDGHYIMSGDFTMAMSCKNIINGLKARNIHVIFTDLKLKMQHIIQGALSDSEKFVYFSSCEEAQSYIDALYVNKLPIENVCSVLDSHDHQASGENDSGLFEK